MHREDILQLLRYNWWANERILDVMAQLTPKQLAQPGTFDHDSAFQTLLHQIDVEWSWRLFAQQVPAPKDLAEIEPLPDVTTVRAYWQKEQAHLIGYVQGMTEAELAQEVEFGTAQGWGPRSARMWQILVHVVNHGTQHRSELALYCTACGYSPGELGFMGYVQNEK